MYHYHLLQKLKWGGNDIGRRGVGRAVVDGVVEPCPACGSDFERDFDVYIEQDKIVEVRPATGIHDFPQGQTYIVLKKVADSVE